MNAINKILEFIGYKNKSELIRLYNEKKEISSYSLIRQVDNSYKIVTNDYILVKVFSNENEAIKYFINLKG